MLAPARKGRFQLARKTTQLRVHGNVHVCVPFLVLGYMLQCMLPWYVHGAAAANPLPSRTMHVVRLGHCDRIGISGLVAEYIVAIDVTRVRFPADALFFFKHNDWEVSHLDNGPTRA